MDSPASSVGAWDDHYRGLKHPEPYGDSQTYLLAAQFLTGCVTVADWGCGKGWLQRYIGAGYVGIDGSASPFADVVADLATYKSSVEGIVLRHVLEHDHRWAQILDNALGSFTKRAIVILFTPLVERTFVVQTEPDYGDVPVYSFALGDLTSRIPGDVSWSVEHLPTKSFYGMETLIRLER